MTDRSWKAFERRCARDMGTQRIAVTGERHGADFEDGMFVYQAKLGRKMPSYLREWLAGIRGAGASRRPEKIGVVCWKPKYSEDADAVVLVSWRDWVALHGSVSAPEDRDRDACCKEALSSYPAAPCEDTTESRQSSCSGEGACQCRAGEPGGAPAAERTAEGPGGRGAICSGLCGAGKP